MSYTGHLQNLDLSKATIRMYNDYLARFLAWLDGEGMEATEVRGTDLMAYLGCLKGQGKSPQNRSHYLIAIRHYFDWQLSQSERTDNPAKVIKLRGVKSRKLYNLLSREELEALYHGYDAAKPPTGKPATFDVQRLVRQRNKVMLGLTVYQGLLTSEINALTLEDLKLREGTVYIAGRRKSNERVMELKPQQIVELMEYRYTTREALLRFGDATRQWLFLPAPASGQPKATANDGINIWKRLTEDVCELQPRFLNFLQVRTSVITLWLGQYNLRQVQYMAGHRYVSTTESYLINRLEDLQDDIDRFHPIG